MTRGTFYLITKRNVYESIEFNGDMYPSGHGIRAFNLLKKVTSIKDFIRMIINFNNKHHKYKRKLVYEKQYDYSDIEPTGFFTEKDLVNLNPYFDKFRFFSDYLFIKNLSDTDIKVITTNNQSIILPINTTVVFNYGKILNDIEHKEMNHQPYVFN